MYGMASWQSTVKHIIFCRILILAVHSKTIKKNKKSKMGIFLHTTLPMQKITCYMILITWHQSHVFMPWHLRWVFMMCYPTKYGMTSKQVFITRDQSLFMAWYINLYTMAFRQRICDTHKKIFILWHLNKYLCNGINKKYWCHVIQAKYSWHDGI